MGLIWLSAAMDAAAGIWEETGGNGKSAECKQAVCGNRNAEAINSYMRCGERRGARKCCQGMGVYRGFVQALTQREGNAEGDIQRLAEPARAACRTSSRNPYFPVACMRRNSLTDLLSSSIFSCSSSRITTISSSLKEFSTCTTSIQ